MSRFQRGRRVCVIGAGCAGLAAAARLQEKGWDATVFERSDRVGGKCYTRSLTVGGRSLAFDLGATVVAVSYRNLVWAGRVMGERTKTVNPYEMIDDEGRITGLRRRYWPSGRRLRLVMQFFRYLRHVRGFYANHVTPTGFADEMPEAFEVPFAQYCRDNGMGELASWFELPIVAWGYGDLEKLPTWYVFGEIDVTAAFGVLTTVSLGASKLVQAWENGFGNLLERMAEHHGLDVGLDAAVQSIRRTAEGITIQTASGESEFDYLVISAPQVVRALQEPSAAEKGFLDDIVHSPYATILCTIDRKLSSKLIIESSLGRVDAVKLIAAQHPDCEAVVCYANISAGTNVEQVHAMVDRDLAKLGITLKEVHEVALWPDYFPHFSSHRGYRALLEAQGRDRTVYVGAINRFEFTEAATETARAMIDAHFADHVAPSGERFTGLKNAWHMLVRAAR